MSRFGNMNMMTLKKMLLVLGLTILLSSCYTMLYPPATAPITQTTITTETVGSSSLGGYYSGWDPYWVPSLQYTGYYYDRWSSYYDPYNYYDYHHSHYTPIYIVGEERKKQPSRDYSRDEEIGDDRDRDRKIDDVVNKDKAPVSSSSAFPGSGFGSASTSIGNSKSQPAPKPVEPRESIQPAQPIIPIKPTPPRDRKEIKPITTPKERPVRTPRQEVIKPNPKPKAAPVRTSEVKRSSNKKKKDSEAQPPPKRERKRR